MADSLSTLVSYAIQIHPAELGGSIEVYESIITFIACVRFGDGPNAFVTNLPNDLVYMVIDFLRDAARQKWLQQLTCFEGRCGHRTEDEVCKANGDEWESQVIPGGIPRQRYLLSKDFGLSAIFLLVLIPSHYFREDRYSTVAYIVQSGKLSTSDVRPLPEGWTASFGTEIRHLTSSDLEVNDEIEKRFKSVMKALALRPCIHFTEVLATEEVEEMEVEEGEDFRKRCQMAEERAKRLVKGKFCSKDQLDLD